MSSNSIGDDGAKAIAEALKVNAVVTTLNLSSNSIGVEGAKAIAEALKVNPVLTKLSLKYNETMGDAGKQAVQDAVKDRSGFELEFELDTSCTGCMEQCICCCVCDSGSHQELIKDSFTPKKPAKSKPQGSNVG